VYGIAEETPDFSHAMSPGSSHQPKLDLNFPTAADRSFWESELQWMETLEKGIEEGTSSFSEAKHRLDCLEELLEESKKEGLIIRE